jgi:hypothetical protein
LSEAIELPNRLTVKFEFLEPFSIYLVVDDELAIGLLNELLSVYVLLISVVKVPAVGDDSLDLVCFGG